MDKKSSHRIIVFTGGVATGKSTIKTVLIDTLNKIEIPYYEISEIRNLNINLLKDFLKNKPTNVFYLLESKINPENIKELKKSFKNVFVIGTHSDLMERIKRYQDKNCKFNNIKSVKQNSIKVFTHEEDQFHITETVLNCDTLIENHEILPHDIEISLFEGLIDKGFIDSDFIDKNIPLPQRGKKGSTKESVLLKKDISSLLNTFLSQNKNKYIFVIQGGNRYIFSLLSKQKNKGIRSIKLLDISKINISVLLNTLLTQKERISSISKKTQLIILSEFSKLSKDKQNNIKNLIFSYGFTSINTFLKYTSTGEALKLFGSFIINSPFSYPADDRKIRQEFNNVLPFATQTIKSIDEKQILKSLLLNTSFYKAFNKKTILPVFIDDVFYRGRTYYTLIILSLLLNIKSNQWKLYTLCSDRVSKNIFTEKIKVLKRGVLYPFENSIQTEKGYWEECNDYFVFRDMNFYFTFLSTIIGIKNNEEIITNWNNLIDKIVKIVKYKNLSKQLIKTLIELYIFYITFNKKLSINAILDQRAKDIGYCTPFIKLISTWINQEEPRWKRQEFKNKINNCITIITSLENNLLIKDAINIYKKYNKEIDYSFLKLFFNVNNTEETRECEIKFAILSTKQEHHIQNILKENGFLAKEEQLETDYIPDTSDYLCRKNNILLRFRKIKTHTKTDILLTLKIGKTNIQGFQDAHELQYYFSNIHKNIFTKINKILKKLTNTTLPFYIHTFKKINPLKIYLKKIGFPSLRTYIEKKRTIYFKDDINVTFDVFPENIGKYLEIETQSPYKLKLMINLLQLPKNQLELKDYGDIVKTKKEGMSEIKKRTALFSTKN